MPNPTIPVIFADIVEDIEALPELPKISGFWLILILKKFTHYMTVFTVGKSVRVWGLKRTQKPLM